MAYQALHSNAGNGKDDALGAILRTSRLRKNERDYWVIDYSEGRRSKTFSTGTKDFATAQNALTEWLTQTRQKQLDGGKVAVTINSLIDVYLNTLDPRPRKKADDCLHWVRKTLGGLHPRELTQQVIVDYSRTRMNQLTGDLIKTGTLRRELSAMVTAINHAIHQRIISNLDGPAKLKLPENSPPRPTYMNREEEERFWDAAQRRGGQIGLFVALGLETAARKSAILGLTWDRVNFREGVVDYQDPKVPVTKKRRAIVPISDRLRPVLERAQLTRGESDRLFDSGLRVRYETWAKRIGMAWVTPHVMRHTWATLNVNAGVSLFHVAKVLGDTIATVEKTYAKVSMDDLRVAVNRRWKQSS